MDYIAQDILSGNQGNVINLNWGKALQRDLPHGCSSATTRSSATACSRISGSSPRARSATPTSACSSRTRGRSTTSSPSTSASARRTRACRPTRTTRTCRIRPHEFTFGDKLAPRVGFAWDVTGDGKNKVYGNWGIFYDILKLELGLTSFGGDKWISHYYTLDTPNWDTLDVVGLPADLPGHVPPRRPTSGIPSNESIDPNMDPMKLQEWSFGYERELAPRIGGFARYIHKQVDVAIEDIGALDATGNEIYVIGNPGFHNAADVRRSAARTTCGRTRRPCATTTRWKSASTSGSRTTGACKGSYTLSRLYGNYSGLSQSDENGRTQPNIGRNFDYTVMSFDENGDAGLRSSGDGPSAPVQAAGHLLVQLRHDRWRELLPRQRHAGVARGALPPAEQLPGHLRRPVERRADAGRSRRPTCTSSTS